MPGRPPSFAPSAPTGPDDTFVLAVDLGTGGPKVAVLSSSGRIVAHAFRPVGLDLTEDGGAEQSPATGGRPSSPRPARPWPRAGWRPSGSSGSAAPRSGRAPCRSTTRATPSVPPSSGWTPAGPGPSARPCAGALNVQGYSASKLARWVRRTGGIPSLSGKDPVGHIHFLRSERPDVYRAAAVFLEPVDYPQPAPDRPGPRLPRLHHGALGHRQPRHPRRGLRRAAGRTGRPGAGHAARARAHGQHPRRPRARRRRASSACSPARRWWRGRATCTRPPSARAPWPTSTGTSTSGPRAGSAATSPSRRPTR